MNSNAVPSYLLAHGRFSMLGCPSHMAFFSASRNRLAHFLFQKKTKAEAGRLKGGMAISSGDLNGEVTSRPCLGALVPRTMRRNGIFVDCI